MSAWAPSSNAQFRDYDMTIGTVGGSALPGDTAPNSAAPDGSRVFFTPFNQGTMSTQKLLILVAVGGTATVVGWAYSQRAARWYQIFTQAINNPDQAVTIGVGVTTNSIPDGVPIFLQLTGTPTAAFVGAMIH